jgi:hypothetical protein
MNSPGTSRHIVKHFPPRFHRTATRDERAGPITPAAPRGQPKDKERAQTVTKTKPGHPQPITKKGNKRPPRKKSCVYRKLKLGRSGGEVRQEWRVI